MTNNTQQVIHEQGELLPNDYPVYGDYIYMADDKPIRSDIFGDVSDLKRDLKSLGVKFENIYSAKWRYQDGK